MPRLPFDRRTLVALAVVVLAALAIRLVVLAERAEEPGFDVPIVDALVYDQTARQLAAGEELHPRMFWQPLLYPAGLSVVYRFADGSIAAAKVLQAILGALTCGLTFLLGWRLLEDRRLALGAAAIPTLYGPLILYEGELLAAGPAAFFAVALVLLVTFAADRPGIGTGAAFGFVGILASLTRPTFFPFLAVAAVWLAWRWRRDAVTPGRIGAALASGLGAFVLVAVPFAALQEQVTGHFGFLPGSGGLNAYIGNNPDVCSTLAIRPGDEWGELISMPDRAGVSGYAEKNRWFSSRVLEWAGEHPLDFAAGLGAKSLRVLSSRELPRNLDVYVARAESGVLAALAWKLGPFGFPFGLVLPLAVLGVVRGRRLLVGGGGSPVLLFLVFYPAAIVLVFVTARYRVPVVPVLAVPAALGAAELARVARERGRALGVALAILAGSVLVATLPGPFCEEELDMEADVASSLAYALTQRGEVEAAVETYRRAIASDPDREDAHYNLARLLAGQGDVEGAEAHYREAVRAEPDFAGARNNLASILERRGDLAGAAEQYRRAVEADPALAAAWRNLARALLRTGEPREALEAADALAAAAPQDREVAALRGAALLQLGELPRAVEELERAADSEPRNARLRLDLGTALFGLRDLPAAERAFREALAIEPRNPSALSNLGAVLATAGDLEGARRSFEEAVRAAPGSVDARTNLASILLRLGDEEGAARELRESLRRRPGDPRARGLLEQIEN